MEMCDHKADGVVLPREVHEGVEQGDGIRPAADRDDNGLAPRAGARPLRNEAVGLDGRADGFDEAGSCIGWHGGYYNHFAILEFRFPGEHG